MVAPSITPSAASGTIVCQLPGRGSPWKMRTMRPRGASRSVTAKCAAILLRNGQNEASPIGTIMFSSLASARGPTQ